MTNGSRLVCRTNFLGLVDVGVKPLLEDIESRSVWVSEAFGDNIYQLSKILCILLDCLFASVSKVEFTSSSRFEGKICWNIFSAKWKKGQWLVWII